MTTEELVDELVQRFNGWNRDGDHGVLRYLNSAHEILMSQGLQQNTIFDLSTGKLPYLQTTQGVYTYIMPDNVWRVKNILIYVDRLRGYPGTPWNNYQTGLLTARLNYRDGLIIGGIQYSKVPFIRTTDRNGPNNLARVMFTQDPETKTDLYQVLSYRVPIQILSESIQPDIPTPWDYELLLAATAKLIEGVQNGNYDEARRFVRLEMRPLLAKELGDGDQGDLDMEPCDRGF